MLHSIPSGWCTIIYLASPFVRTFRLFPGCHHFKRKRQNKTISAPIFPFYWLHQLCWDRGEPRNPCSWSPSDNLRPAPKVYSKVRGVWAGKISQVLFFTEGFGRCGRVAGMPFILEWNVATEVSEVVVDSRDQQSRLSRSLTEVTFLTW